MAESSIGLTQGLTQVVDKDVSPPPEPGVPHLPYPFLLDVSSLDLTDRQLEKISADNDNLQLELTAKGELVIMPPGFAFTGWQETRLLLQVANWSDQNGTGVTFNSASGFRLLNGAVYAPDVSWVLRERWDTLSEDERKSFSPCCPDFVLELRSPSDTLVSVQRKMEEYVENGARLGWLIDPSRKRVHIYRPGTPVEVLEDPATVSGEPVLPGFALNLQEIW